MNLPSRDERFKNYLSVILTKALYKSRKDGYSKDSRYLVKQNKKKGGRTDDDKDVSRL